MPSKVRVKHFNVLEWIIENFICCPIDHENSLDCPLFLCDGKVQMKIFPRGALDDIRDHISCFLEIKDVGESERACKLEITDGEGYSIATKEVRVTPNVEIGIFKFVEINKVLNRIAKSKSNSLIVKCHLKKTSPETLTAELVARTLIGVESSFFTWCIENLESDSSRKKIIYFPKLSRLEFCLRVTGSFIDIVVFKGEKTSDDDDVFGSGGDDEEFHRDIDELIRDDGYGREYNRALVFEISFISMERKKLTYLYWPDLDSKHTRYRYKKDLLSSNIESTSLKCEVSISFGTYVKHINPKVSSSTRYSLMNTTVRRNSTNVE